MVGPLLLDKRSPSFQFQRKSSSSQTLGEGWEELKETSIYVAN